MASASSVRLWKHGVQRRVVAALNGVANARARWNHAMADGKAAGAAMTNACLTAGCVAPVASRCVRACGRAAAAAYRYTRTPVRMFPAPARA